MKPETKRMSKEWHLSFVTKTQQVPDTATCREYYADCLLGEMRSTLGALHASGEHYHKCLIFITLDESSSTCS
jgi:hypothetical protein